MAATWDSIRDGVKTRLDSIANLSPRDTMPDSLPDKDTATVLPGNPVIEPAGHHSKYFVNFRVLVRVTRGKIRDAQERLDALIWPLGASSVQAAIEGDRTLGSTVDTVKFLNVTGYGGEEDRNDIARAEVNFQAIITAGSP